MIGDGVIPSNTEQGYILRRLLRRAVRHADKLHMKHGSLFWLAETVIENYKDVYSELPDKREIIKTEVDKEEHKFRVTLENGMREFNKWYRGPVSGYVTEGEDQKLAEELAKHPKTIPGFVAFNLFSTHGFPIELTIEIAKDLGMEVDVKGFGEQMKKHQDLSRSGAEQKFKGGLADTSDMSVKYHTATHLLHQALHDVLGDGVGQKGSNITPERLRFDFSYGAKMTDEQKQKVEDIVNEKIQSALPMQNIVMKREEAEKTGAWHFFGEKYGDEISIYFVGNDLASAYSKEFCGGPHVKNTIELAGPEKKWRFKIQKEEAVSQGVRRIKAVLD